MTTYKFPNELVSNEVKKSRTFAKDFVSAIWSEWSSKLSKRDDKFDELELYSLGKHPIERIEKNIRRKYIKQEYLHYDPEDRVKFLPQLLRQFKNSVDMSQFVPVIKGIDSELVSIKKQRKDEKMKLFHAKDFLEDMANSGQPIVPTEQIPSSKEQVELEELTAKPLRVERGELKALHFVALSNNLHLKQKQWLDDVTNKNLMVARVDVDSYQGITIRYIPTANFICDKKTDAFFTDARYFGERRRINVGTFKNICAESGIKVSDDDIKKMVGCSDREVVTNEMMVDVLYYTFKTFFREDYKKKIDRKTKAIRLIDRSNDIGTDKEYNPKALSDISEKVSDTYDVWFEGVMALDENHTIIRHRLVSNMPKHRGKIFSPYVVCSPRTIGIVEEVKPQIDSIQQLRLKILHQRNMLRGNITEIDPDAIANIALGDKTLSAEDVLSMYFSMQLAFRRTRDDEGDMINGARPMQEIPESIPRALIELTSQYISEIQTLQNAFGAVQYDQVKPDPKTQNPFEGFRFSDSTALRDYTDAMYQFTINIYQLVSARLNDAMEWKSVKELFRDNIGTDDVEAITQWIDDRPKHRFDVLVSLIPSAQEKADFLNDLNIHFNNGELDALDKNELKNILDPMQARYELRLRLEANRKRMQQFELEKQTVASNANIEASNVAAANKSKLLAQEHQQKMELEEKKFQQNAFLLQKEGEIKLEQTNIQSNSKLTAAQWTNQFNADLTKFKKEQDAKLRNEIQDKSADYQSQLIQQREGKIDRINMGTPTEEVDLSTI